MEVLPENREFGKMQGCGPGQCRTYRVGKLQSCPVYHINSQDADILLEFSAYGYLDFSRFFIDF